MPLSVLEWAEEQREFHERVAHKSEVSGEASFIRDTYLRIAFVLKALSARERAVIHALYLLGNDADRARIHPGPTPSWAPDLANSVVETLRQALLTDPRPENTAPSAPDDGSERTG